MQHTQIELDQALETNLEIYMTEGNVNRPAIFIIPGGGYNQFMNKDTEKVALSFLTKGFQAIVVHYPIGEHKSYQEAKDTTVQAVEYVINHAVELNIDADKMGMIGFSAGGQIAAEYSTLADNALKFVILGYPVLGTAIDTNMGIQSEDIWELVTPMTTPTFIFGSINDTVTPYDKNILPYTSALFANHVSFELHEFSSGKHGISLANEYVADENGGEVYPEFAQWFSLALTWANGFLK